MLSSFFSGISGLIANSSSINVVGNNIANVNTVGFKGARATFEDVLYQTVNGTSGSSQVGRGTALSSVDTSFSQGSFESTSESTDLAIGGKGFFIVRQPESETNYYTRAGQFRFDADGNMTNPAGDILQGRAIDRTTNAPYGVDTDIIISQAPSEPRATQFIGMSANLQSDSPVAGTLGSLSGAANGSVTSATLSDGKYPRTGTYTISYAAATGITVSCALTDPTGAATGTTVTYGPVAVAAGTTYTNLGGSGLDITTDAALVDGTSRTIAFQGFSTDYVIWQGSRERIDRSLFVSDADGGRHPGLSRHPRAGRRGPEAASGAFARHRSEVQQRLRQVDPGARLRRRVLSAARAADLRGLRRA